MLQHSGDVEMTHSLPTGLLNLNELIDWHTLHFGNPPAWKGHTYFVDNCICA
jgi:hypothetical protein